MNSSKGFLVTVLLISSIVAASLLLLTKGSPLALFSITIGYYSYDTFLSCLFLYLTGQGLRATESPRPCSNGQVPALSLLIAAHNEASCISKTLRSVLSQEGVDFEIIVASDGSSDSMNDTLIRDFDLKPEPAHPDIWTDGLNVRLLILPKAGKAAALNRALPIARNPVVVTLDADTDLAPCALLRLASAFQNENTVAAGGFIYVRNAPKSGWLARYQFVEYLKNFMWRIGLSHAGICLQVSGAFGAIRLKELRHSGGFESGSLTEDYEIIYRLHRDLHLKRQSYHIAMVADAVAYTDCPETVGTLIRQRTRWFTGFLQTLWDYRRMIGNPAYGRIGLGILPVKCVDAVLPLWGLTSFLVLMAGLLSGQAHLTRTAFYIFGSKWLIDMITVSTLFYWHRRLNHPSFTKISIPVTVFCVMTEGLVFHWLRHLAVLQAYIWWMGRIQRWEQPRWNQSLPDSPQP